MAGYRGGMGGAAGMQNLMKQAQKMQEEMRETEALLDDWEIVGTAGGIEIDKSVIDPEDEEMLEDLILAAINDGYKKADAVFEEKMGKFGGLGGMGGLL